MIKGREALAIVLVTMFITLMLVYSFVSPMGRSEAHAVLIGSGTMVTSANEISYHSANQALTELELEALYTLSKVYVIDYITTVR